MKFDSNTPRSARSIGQKDGPSFSVKVPQPYVPGAHELTEGEASALNQIVAENLSNNLRAKLVEGIDNGEGKARTPYTDETAQQLVDTYLADYEIGVRRAGSGEPRVTDPVEREARKIARAKAVDMVKENGGKPSDFDLAPIAELIFSQNKDVLMKEGKKIVDQAAKAAGGLNLGGIDLSAAAKPKAEAAPAAEAPAEEPAAA